MARVVVLPVAASGHVYPTLPLAQALLARGEEVSYCLPDQFMATIAGTGAVYLPFRSNGRGFAWQPISCEELFVAMPLHQAALSFEALPQVLGILRAEQPDYLIYDASCLWGRLAARILHLPAVRFHTSFVLNEQIGPVFSALLDQADRATITRTAEGPWLGDDDQITFRRAVEHLCATYDQPPISLQSFFAEAEPLNLAPIPPAFQPGVQHFDARYRFIGPSLAPREESDESLMAQLTRQPTLYISLGSVCNRETGFIRSCFAAFGGTDPAIPEPGRSPEERAQGDEPPWQVVLSSGAINMATVGRIPENFIVRQFVPQLEVLQQATAFLTHGGMNSVMEALWYGVPMVVVPQMTEQAVTARRVDELGLGLSLERSEVTPESLREAVRRVASDRQMQARVQRMQETVRNMGGAQAAADAVIEFTRGEGQKGWSWPSHREGF